MKVKSESEVAQSCLTLSLPRGAYQAPPSMGFSRQDYWSGVPLPSLVYDTIHRYTLISHVLYWLFIVYRHGVRAFKMARVVKNSPANKRDIKTCYARDVTKFCQENTLVIANTLF